MGRRRGGSARRFRLPTFANFRLLTAQPAQVVELRPAYITAHDDLDAVDHRRVHGERPFHPHAKADLADRERLPDSATLAADDNALEVLHTGAVALDHADADVERVAGAE